LPGFTRQTILFAKKMDSRVEPAHDDGDKMPANVPSFRGAR
jgi:hypothetical protein